MSFEKCMGTLGVVYIWFGKCIGTIGVHRGRLYEVWEGYGDPMWVIGGHLYEVWGTYGDHRESFI